MKHMYERLSQKKPHWTSLLLVLTLLVGMGVPLARQVMAEAKNANDAGTEQRDAQDENENEDNEENEGNDENDADAEGFAGQVTISFQQANNAALATNPGAEVICAALENEDGMVVYNVTLRTANGAYSEVKVDVSTGDVLPATSDEDRAQQAEDADGETNDDQDTVVALAEKIAVTQEQAIEAALAANPGATIFETDLGEENGVVVYELTLKTAQGSYVEVKVDAVSAQVLPEDIQNVEYEDGQEIGEQETDEDDD